MDYNDYFQSFKDYFWQWEEGGEVIAMPEGVTVAYRDYVCEVLEHLKVQGIPPFGALLLALIATNSNGLNTLLVDFEAFGTRLKTKKVYDGPLMYLENALPFLKVLADVPNQYKQGSKRIQLLQTVFADAHKRVSADKSEEFTEQLLRQTGSRRYLHPEPFNEAVFAKDFRVITLAGKKFPTVEALLDAIAGIPQAPPVPFLEEEEEPADVPKDFVQQLIENDQTFHVGALIRRIWSGLNIPFHNVLPSEQPLGGVSDISNKGDFDKLLISEFAYDDLTFVSRLANNEALYIQREIPPASNPLRRVLLIDVSLKNWGSTKTMAYALMLAIAKHPKTDMECTAFAVGKSYSPILYDNIDGLINSLQYLDEDLDSVQGLELFFKEQPKDASIEVFYISAFDAVKSTRMKQLMADHHARFKYWIHTDPDGRIGVYRNRHNSKTHIQDMWLPLDELWKPVPRNKSKKPDPPVIQVAEPGTVSSYPLLLAYPSNIKANLLAPDGEKFAITAHKTVLHFPDKDIPHHAKGWEVVYESLPFVRGEFAMGKWPNGNYVLLAFNPMNRELNLINITTGERTQGTFQRWKPSQSRYFFFHEERFYYRTFHQTFSTLKNEWTNAEMITREVPWINLSSIYAEQAEARDKLYFPAWSLLKNITSIHINGKGNLVLNDLHELRLESWGVVLRGVNGADTAEEAARTSKNLFTFRDGTSITVHPDGMLILRSSNEHIPTIYVPTAMDATLGLAANGEFAGNKYFYKSGTTQVEPAAFWKLYMERFLDTIICNSH